MFRFLVGGLAVSAFAVASDMLYPKVFAGLLGAAPSVALASLGLTVYYSGADKASVECRSMIAGAAAFLAYVFLVRLALIRSRRCITLPAATGLLLVWLACALGLERLFLR